MAKVESNTTKEKNELLDLASECFDSDESYKLLLQSIELHFQEYQEHCFLDEVPFSGEIKDELEWETEWKSHDGDKIYLSEQKRIEESYYSTKLYSNLSMVFGKKDGMTWRPEYSHLISLFEVAQMWCELDYEVYMVRFSWTRNYSVCFQQLVSLYETEPDYWCNLEKALNSNVRFYVKRK